MARSSNKSCRERLVAALAALVLAAACHCMAAEDGASQSSQVALSAGDRVLVLSPHPDDETIACGGIIQKAVAGKIPCKVVFLTNGDDNELSFLVYRKHPVIFSGAALGMGVLRQEEAVAATGILGLSPEDLTFLGYPDYGTFRIWLSHWGASKPYRSLLTHKTSVPYKNAFRYGATYKGEDLLADLTTIIRDYKPTMIFVSHPADRNGDHWALYLFTKVALWDLRDEMNPAVYPFLVHYGKWPVPRGLKVDLPLEPPTELATRVPWKTSPLAPAQEDVKLKALQAHKTQYRYSRSFLSSFVRQNELFGEPPDVPISDRGAVEVAGPTPAAEGEAGLPAQAADVEAESLIGLERRYATLEGGNLVLTAQLSRKLARDVEISVYAFGWRPDRSFVDMPKIHVRIGPFGHSVYDQGKKLASSLVAVTKEPQLITVRVPLYALGEPERVITNARTYLAEVPLDNGQWIILRLIKAASVESSTGTESLTPEALETGDRQPLERTMSK